MREEQYLYLDGNEKIVSIAEHQYKWKISEILGLVGYGFIGTLLALFVQPLVLGVAILSVIPYFVYINISRKKKSKLTFAITPSGLRLYKGLHSVGNNNSLQTNDIDAIALSVDTRGDKYIVLRPKPGKDGSVEGGLKIPERIYKTDSFRGFVDSLTRAVDIGSRISKDAEIEIYGKKSPDIQEGQ